MSNCVFYPGITRIGYLSADLLPAYTTYNAIAGAPVVLFTAPLRIPLSGYADLQVEQSNEHNGTAESLTLSFRTAHSLPRHNALAFIVWTAAGQCYLIGQKEQPAVAIQCTQLTGTPDGDPAAYRYEVKHTAPIALKPCKVMV